MRGETDPNAEEPLEPLILMVRGQRVLLDADLARLYGATTKALNQAVKRNIERFPQDFAFQLTIAEAASTKALDLIEEKSNRSQIVTGSQRHRDPRLKTLLQHDAALRDVYRKLQPLLAPPSEPQKPRIGF